VAPRFLGTLLATFLCGACVSYPELRFAPSVHDAELRDGNDVMARIAVVWLGASERDGVYELFFRVRIENHRSDPFQIEPAKFVLLDAALQPLGPARVDGLPAAVAGEMDATFELAFPVPKERDPYSAEMGTLELRTQLDGGRWDWSTRFQRVARYAYGYPYPYPYYGSWWGPPWHYHAGVYWGYPY